MRGDGRLNSHSIEDEILLEQNHVEGVSPVPGVVLHDSVSVDLRKKERARSALSETKASNWAAKRERDPPLSRGSRQ